MKSLLEKHYLKEYLNNKKCSTNVSLISPIQRGFYLILKIFIKSDLVII